MRSLTAAQKREITSDGEVILLLESTPINYASKHINTLAAAKYDVGFEVDDIEEDINWLGGMGAVTGVTCRINKVDDFLDYIENGGTRNYIENEEVTVSVQINDTKHTLYKGVFQNVIINQDNVEFEIEDEANKCNVDILTQVTKENYPNVPDDLIGVYLPILYNESTITTWFAPCINMQQAYPYLYYAHHNTLNYYTNEIIKVFFPDIDTYGELTGLSDTHSCSSSDSYFTFLDADCIIQDYTRYTVGRQGDEIADIANIHNVYDSTAGSCNVDASETLSFIVDFGDIGYIYATTSFSMEVSGTATQTPDVKMVNAISGAAIATDALSSGANAVTVTWNGPDDDGSPIWSFQNIREREFQIVCAAGESIDLTWVGFNVTFAMYDKNAKRIIKERGKQQTKSHIRHVKERLKRGYR